MHRFAHYFPSLTEHDWHQLNTYCSLLREWNSKINLISRKDIDFLEQKHILPLLPIITWEQWKNPKTVLDMGTGGGIPGIPLAILYPKIHFTLLDATQKKIGAVEDMTRHMGLTNVTCCSTRLEQHHQTYDAIVGRAVTAFDQLIKQVHPFLHKDNHGIFYWTGGDLSITLSPRLKKQTTYFDLSAFFDHKYCLGKKILHFLQEETF